MIRLPFVRASRYRQAQEANRRHEQQHRQLVAEKREIEEELRRATVGFTVGRVA